MLYQFIHIDPQDSRTLQDQIKGDIAKAIFAGFVPKNTSIMSSRRLAEQLKVSRNTILRVYEQLAEEGVLVPIERKGYYVNPQLELQVPSAEQQQQPGSQNLNWVNYLNAEHTVSDIAVKNLNQYPYLFVSGMVDEDLFPVSEWRKCSIQSLNKSNHRSWTSDDHDYHELIEQIRTRVLTKRGIFVGKENIAITLGSQNSLYFLSKLLVSKRSCVAMENPGYPEALHQFQARRARVMPIEVDRNGMVIDERLTSANVVYTTPSNQFPTTVRMSAERRKALMDCAEQHDFLVIEDDFEHDINFMEHSCPPLRCEYQSERIIYISSFTSSIAPGLRIGFIVAAAPLIAQIKSLQVRTHSLPPKSNCQTLALFLSLGYYDVLAQKLLKRYRDKWLTMEKAMNYYFPQSGAIPSLAGTAFWVEYKQGFDAERFEQLAQEQGILINNGAKYFSCDHKNNSFRLSFQSIRCENIREGIKQLAAIAKQILPIPRIEDCASAPLDSAQIRAALTNQTLLTKDCFNIPYRITLQADGKLLGISERPNDMDEGYWWVENNKFVYQWRNWQFSDIRYITIVQENGEIKRFDEQGYFIGEARIAS